MASAKTKVGKKGTSFQGFARALQTDIARLGKSMETGFTATKEDIRKVREEMATRAALLEVRDDVKRLNEIVVSKADLSETIRRELDASPYAKEADVKDLHERMLRVEEAVGIKPKRRAA
jgi:hypothetical protein